MASPAWPDWSTPQQQTASTAKVSAAQVGVPQVGMPQTSAPEFEAPQFEAPQFEAPEPGTSQTDSGMSQTDGNPSRHGGGGPMLFGLGPVGLAAIVAVVLILFGIGAVVVPAILSGGSSDGEPPAFAAPQSGDPNVAAGPNDVPSEEPSADGTGPTPTPTSSRPTGSVTTNAQFEERVVDLVNRERKRAKRRCNDELRVDGRLQSAARAHSVDMATQNFLNHTGTDGSSAVERMRAAGYGQGLSENIAAGNATPEQVMRAWLNRPGDRANLLDCDAKAIGVGVAYNGRSLYWTQNFGRA